MKPKTRAAAVLLTISGSIVSCGDVTSDLITRSPQKSAEICNTSADCAADEPYCDIAAARCVQCLASENCATGWVCALPAHRCVEACGGPDDCPSTSPVCDASTGQCRGCTEQAECGGALCDATTGRCVECFNNDECISGDEQLCDTAIGRCVECITTSHCPQAPEECSSVLHKCAVPCSEEGEACPFDDPYCDPAIGFCVECQRNEDCGGGELCRGAECVDDPGA